MNTKICSVCNNEISIENFYKDSTKKSGVGSACKSCTKQRARDRYKENPELYKARSKANYKANPEAWNQSAQEWAKAHPQKRKASVVKWAQANLDWHSAYEMNRRALKLQRTPPWARQMMKDYMPIIMKQRDELTRSTGIQQSIDHIVPLKGKLVSGLHVPWNLQIMELSKNISKNNTFNIDDVQ
jgi:hypothetical protein